MRGKTRKVLGKRSVVAGVIISLAFLLVGCALLNSPPVPSFLMSPTAGEAPLTVDLDASGSTDADGNIVSYEWDFGDGESETGVTVEHIFAMAGSYAITLTVTDDQGKAASATQEITVAGGGSAPPPPPPPPA